MQALEKIFQHQAHLNLSLRSLLDQVQANLRQQYTLGIDYHDITGKGLQELHQELASQQELR